MKNRTCAVMNAMKLMTAPTRLILLLFAVVPTLTASCGDEPARQLESEQPEPEPSCESMCAAAQSLQCENEATRERDCHFSCRSQRESCATRSAEFNELLGCVQSHFDCSDETGLPHALGCSPLAAPLYECLLSAPTHRPDRWESLQDIDTSAADAPIRLEATTGPPELEEI